MSTGELTPDVDCNVLVSRQLRHFAEDHDRELTIDESAVAEIIGGPLQADRSMPTQVLFQLRPRMGLNHGEFAPAEQLEGDHDRITVYVNRHDVEQSNDIEVSKILAHEAQHAADFERLGSVAFYKKGSYVRAAGALLIFAAWETGVLCMSAQREYSSNEQVQQYAFVGFESAVGVLAGALGGYAVNPLEIRARRYARQQPRRRGLVVSSIVAQEEDGVRLTEYVVPPRQNREA
jgi:hypothetical protein